MGSLFPDFGAEKKKKKKELCWWNFRLFLKKTKKSFWALLGPEKKLGGLRKKKEFSAFLARILKNRLDHKEMGLLVGSRPNQP